MNDAQKQLLDLAVEFDSICRKHDIAFAVGFGCAIGVERNGGFLPWDDDLDLIITRDQYNKLERALEGDMPANRALVNEKNYPGYHHAEARYVNLQSSRLASFRLMDGSPLGQLLELFIFDPIPSGKEAQREYAKWMWLYTELQSSDTVVARDYSSPSAVDADLYHNYLHRVEREGREAILGEIEREHLTFPEEECEWYACRWGCELLAFRKEWLESVSYRDCDGYKLPLLKHNIEHLQVSYGFEWNIVPPPTEQRAHSVIVSTTIPCLRHSDAIREKGRELGLEEVLRQNKADRLEGRFARLDLQRCAALGKRAYLQALADDYAKAKPAFSLEELVGLRDTFAPFFEVFFEKNYYKWEFYPELDDTLIKTMFQVLVYADRVDDARVFREAYGVRRCGGLAEVPEILMWLQACKYRAEYDNARAIVSLLVDEYELAQHVEAERARAWLFAHDVSSGKSEGDSAEAESFFAELMHARDPEIKMYRGDVLMAFGKTEEARICYKEARNTNDGMLLRALDAASRKS